MQKKNSNTSSEFLKNAITLVSGTTLAQSVSLISAPILYRIYEPHEYGTLGLYMAIVGVITPFSTLQYHQTILLEKDEEDALSIVSLCRFINIILTLITLSVFAPILYFSSDFLNNPDIKNWLVLLPFSIFFGGQSMILREWANKKKAYKLLTTNTILTSLLVPSVSITIGLLTKGSLGLFLGLLVGQIFPTLILVLALSRKHDLRKVSSSLEAKKKLLKKYLDFPKFSLVTEFINRFTNQLPVFMLSTYVNSTVVGQYNLTVRMLDLPIQLISRAIAEVFRQQASKDYHNFGNCKELFIKTLKFLVIISIIPFCILLVYGPDIFAVIFSEKWRGAGTFARVLGALFLFRFFCNPLSFLFVLKQKMRESFHWHLWMLASNIIIFYLGFTLTNSYMLVLSIFSANYVIIYSIYLFRSYQFSLP